MGFPFGSLRLLLVAAVSLVPAGAQAQPFLFPRPLPPPSQPELGAPRIHIESSFPITLHRSGLFFASALPEITCQAPCDAIVDGRQGDSFFFGGDEIPPSKSFRLIEKSGDVVAHVRAGNFTASKVGSGLLIPGILSIITTATILPFALLTQNPDTRSQLQTATIATAAIGVATLATSIALLVVGHTRFDFENRVGPDGLRF